MSFTAVSSPPLSAEKGPIDLRAHFERFRQHTIGAELSFHTPYGEQRMIYADWTASGRLYRPIEERIIYEMGPFLGNTHTETSITGSSMTKAYHEARRIIKEHVGALPEDVLIPTGSGMTGAVNKFQRILGFRIHERFSGQVHIPEEDRPVVFVSHMEHHSNQTSWIETIADVHVIPACPDGLVDLEAFRRLVREFGHRRVKVAAITSCSNVTGIKTPYHQMARIIHEAGGLCFVDFACSAPYIDMNMRPEDPMEHLDALYFSPHKFLGGPGSSGVLIFKQDLYRNRVPDHPGGGTVRWTNPWGDRLYINTIEDREDGGTPPFLQTIKVALAIRLKDEMGVRHILEREKQLMKPLWDKMRSIPGLHILADQHADRLPVISFNIDGLHYNLGVRLLNDRFGIQSRGGCSCAGTYGHYLLEISQEKSTAIISELEKWNPVTRVGWIRISLHPTMTEEEITFIGNALEALALHHQEWAQDYIINPTGDEFVHRSEVPAEDELVEGWFNRPLSSKD